MTDQLGQLSKGSLDTQLAEEILSFSFTIKTFNWILVRNFAKWSNQDTIRQETGDRRQEPGPRSSPVYTSHLPSHCL